MKAAEYREKRDDLNERRSETYEKLCEAWDERDHLYDQRRAKQLEYGCDEWNHAENELERVREVCRKLSDTHSDLIRQLDELDKLVDDGLEYERPGFAFANRFLPPVPKDRTELSKDELKAPVARWHELLSLVLGMFSGFYVMGAAILYGALVQSIDSSPVHMTIGVAKLVGVLATLLAIAGIYVVTHSDDLPFVDMTASLSARQRFVMGAENWSWLQRLRSVAIYGIYSPMTIIGFPLRFVIGIAVMGVYLRRFKVAKRRGWSDREAVTEAVLASAKFVTGIEEAAMVTIGGALVVIAALLLLKG